MSKIVLVETISSYLFRYAGEIGDDDPKEYALDTLVSEIDKLSGDLCEFSQNHIAENSISHRVISEEEYLKIFDEDNEYMSDWSIEKKKFFIFKENKNDK